MWPHLSRDAGLGEGKAIKAQPEILHRMTGIEFRAEPLKRCRAKTSLCPIPCSRYCGRYVFGMGMSPLRPQLSVLSAAAPAGVPLFRIYQLPLEGRQTVMSARESPS